MDINDTELFNNKTRVVWDKLMTVIQSNWQTLDLLYVTDTERMPPPKRLTCRSKCVPGRGIGAGQWPTAEGGFQLMQLICSTFKI